ncbi:RNA polymerase recycling motor HelD [Neobacillus sp. SM06]|uniref:RNA polymerase recycling motor HelD n=1 Tax=Neobacillus sp. SM06 TaxID=3422492 RepID=UPI003D29C3CC
MSDEQSFEWKKEQERIEFIGESIDAKVRKLLGSAGSVSKDVLNLRRTFWEDVTVNFDEADDVAETAASIKQQAELLSERERTHMQLDQQLQTLARLKFSPYFGRIDFSETGEQGSEKVYIGIASLMDEKDENFLIYDWRAPISSLYYDYAPGPAHYITPGGIIEGEMKLKRQFLIRAGVLKGMFETGITIGDEILQEALGENASNQMKTIVATIQREQNQIIRNERSNLLVVQGVAGSGKTSAALQRVAYLLYRHRGTLNADNILLFSPNPLFTSYVATVLPELGEENMQQSTFQEFIQQRIGPEFEVEDAFSQIEFLLNRAEDNTLKEKMAAIRLKGSLAFKRLLDEYAESLSKGGLLFHDLIFRKEIVVSKQMIDDYFYSLDPGISIPNRLQFVKEWLLKELKKKVKQERKKEWVEEELQYLEKEDYMEAFSRLLSKNHYSDKTFDDFDREQKLLAEMVVKQKFKPLFAKVKKLKFVDLASIYRHFFEKGSEEKKVAGVSWEAICRQTISQLEKMQVSYEDATPLAYLQDLLEGRRSSTSIRHVFIDEAQDYTPFQFALIQHFFPYSKMTLLGDFHQAIFSGATGSPSVITEIFNQGDEVERIELLKTYRSTKPIVEFTKQLLDDGEKIQPFNRSGEKPTVTLVRAPQLIPKILEEIVQLREKGLGTIAVICRTAKESQEVFSLLKKHIPVHLVEKATITFERGVSVIPAYLAKGIEFDGVLLYDISQYKREHERKLFYTACTRAMHELHLFSSSGISPLMKNVHQEKYILAADETENHLSR